MVKHYLDLCANRIEPVFRLGLIMNGRARQADVPGFGFGLLDSRSQGPGEAGAEGVGG